MKKANWRDNKFKEREVRLAIKSILGDDEAGVDSIFEIVKALPDTNIFASIEEADQYLAAIQQKEIDKNLE